MSLNQGRRGVANPALSKHVPSRNGVGTGRCAVESAITARLRKPESGPAIEGDHLGDGCLPARQLGLRKPVKTNGLVFHHGRPCDCWITSATVPVIDTWPPRFPSPTTDRPPSSRTRHGSQPCPEGTFFHSPGFVRSTTLGCEDNPIGSSLKGMASCMPPG